MREKLPSALVLWAVFGLALLIPSTHAELIYTYSPYGGTGSYLISVKESDPVDVDKSAADPDDDHMCWAAAASNILDWGGWGRSPFDRGRSMFQTFLDNWEDHGGWMVNGWSWWMNGEVLMPQYEAFLDGAAGGGNYFPSVDFDDQYYHYGQGSSAVSLPNALGEIDALMQNGWGVTVGVAPIAHALTVWGYQADMVYDPASGTYTKEYRALWFADSDDYDGDGSRLIRQPVYRDAASDKWYFDSGGEYPFLGYIYSIQALKPNPDPQDALPRFDFDIAYKPFYDQIQIGGIFFSEGQLPARPLPSAEFIGGGVPDLGPLNPVPEPATWVLLLCGLLGLSVSRRKPIVAQSVRRDG